MIRGAWSVIREEGKIVGKWKKALGDTFFCSGFASTNPDTPVFLCTSGEVAEGKGDGLRFCTQMMCTESAPFAAQGRRARSQGCCEGELERQPGGKA